ncbi:MAG: hypothetical protein WC869_01730 [Phycisphaerae bacterium]|jgi:hypothetical protein
MDRISGVLKSAVVRPAGSCMIGQQGHQGGQGGQQDSPCARIIEQGDGVSIVEVTCTCGRRMRINCTHAKA